MEDDYLDDDNFEPTEIPQEIPLDEPQENDWGFHSASEYPQYEDDDPWLSDNPFAELISSENPDNNDIPDNEWDSPTISSNDNGNEEDNPELQKHYRGSAISFTGCGHCSCGCGSFGGHNNICTYCGHSYKAHSRYKK